MVAVDDDGADLGLEGVERRLERAEHHAGRAEDLPGDHQLDAAEQLGQTDRGDGEDQAGGVGEPTDDGDLDQGADDQAEQGSGQEGGPVRPAPRHEQVHRGQAGDAGHGAVGEVDDPVGPPDQDEPDGGEAGGRADDGAGEHDAERHPRRQECAEDEPQHAQSDGPHRHPGRGRQRPVHLGGSGATTPVAAPARAVVVPRDLGWRAAGAGHRCGVGTAGSCGTVEQLAVDLGSGLASHGVGHRLDVGAHPRADRGGVLGHWPIGKRLPPLGSW